MGESIESIHRLENAVTQILNIQGWNLTWVGSGMEPYDAYGWSPKENEVVIEYKFRNRYYETKLLEVDKYERMMALEEHIHKIYYVFDPKGNYMFWLNDLSLGEPESIYAPKTTMWKNQYKEKKSYLLEESQAIYSYIYDI